MSRFAAPPAPTAKLAYPPEKTAENAPVDPESANCAALLTDRPVAGGVNREPLRTDLCGFVTKIPRSLPFVPAMRGAHAWQ
jgi:hypothetical protein